MGRREYSLHEYFMGLLCVAWLVMLISPGLVMPLGFAVYGTLLLSIGWSALNPRNSGWRSGLLFVFFAATIPLWVLGMFWLFCKLTGSKWPSF